MILSWTLENSSSELTMGNGKSYTINPGDGYPAGYIGTKYSLRKIKGRYSLSLKSYSGNYVEAEKLPKNLLSTLSSLKGNYSGTIRIRWNGDTLLSPENGEPAIYIGKMKYSENAGKIFPGLDLDRRKDSLISLYSGPQSHLDVGEIWSVPAHGHIRPKLTRRIKFEGEKSRINTITEHHDLINFIIHNIQWEGKRIYITNFGNIISPVSIHLLRDKGIDLEKEITNLDSEGLFNAARFTLDRAKRTFHRFGRPWVMANIGNIEDYDGNGPQPDLSTGPEYFLSDEAIKED